MKRKLLILIAAMFIFSSLFIIGVGALKIGDVNNDSIIDVKDAVLLAQCLADWDVKTDEIVADCNGDRRLDAKDAVLLAQFLADWEVSLFDLSAETLTVSGKEYYLRMDAASLGTPDEKLRSVCGYVWYVFGTGNYKNFFAAGVKDGKVVALQSSGKGFVYGGYKCGDVITKSNKYTRKLLTDKNDNKIVHAVDLYDIYYHYDVDSTALACESKMNFHFANAFRVYHGLSKLSWCDKAAKAAYLHSKDMADQDYFDHTSLNGTPFYERVSAQGIKWRSCGENIAAGTARYTGMENYNAWVNSSGHRDNILGDFSYLGVGAAYNSASSYLYYFTQDFYK